VNSTLKNIGLLYTQIKGEFKTLREASKNKKFLISVLAWFAYIEIAVGLGYVVLVLMLGKDISLYVILHSVVNTGLYMACANYLLRLEDKLNNKGE